MYIRALISQTRSKLILVLHNRCRFPGRSLRFCCSLGCDVGHRIRRLFGTSARLTCLTWRNDGSKQAMPRVDHAVRHRSLADMEDATHWVITPHRSTQLYRRVSLLRRDDCGRMPTNAASPAIRKTRIATAVSRVRTCTHHIM